MNRLLIATAVASLLLPGAAAEAAKKPSPRAKVYDAALTATGGSVTGRAQMVDNARRDTAKLQIRGSLQPGSRYDWTIFRVKGDGGACDQAARGETVSAFGYRVLAVDPSGRATATARSRAFQAVSSTRYGVAVSDADGVVVACGELKLKRSA